MTLQKVWTLLASIVSLTTIFGSPLPGSYDPVPLTPLNGLKIPRSPIFQNVQNLNTFYDDGGGRGRGGSTSTTTTRRPDSTASADGSQGAYWPFSTQRPTVIGYTATPGPTRRPIINVTPRAYASDSALFRSSLPENQPRPTTYEAGGGFPLLNSPQGVQYADGRPTAVPPAARTYGVEALPPNFYFISPKDSSQPPPNFQIPPNNFQRQVARNNLNNLNNLRRIPEGLRRTQYFPTSDQPLSPLVRGGNPEEQYDPFAPFPSATPYSVAPEHPPDHISANSPATDTYETYHTFYAPKYNNYIPITRYSHDAHPTNGQYNVEFESGNGIYQKETGYIKKIEVWNPRTRSYDIRDINVKTGTVSWTSPEGIPFTLSYIADENGFRPVGSHIPSDGSGAAAAGATATTRQGYGYPDPVIPPNPLYHNRRAG